MDIDPAEYRKRLAVGYLNDKLSEKELLLRLKVRKLGPNKFFRHKLTCFPSIESRRAAVKPHPGQLERTR